MTDQTMLDRSTLVRDEQSDRSLGTLMRDLSNDSLHLIQKEAQLFRAETETKIARARNEVMVLGAGGIVAHTGMLAIVAGVILLLAEAMPGWIAALTVGAVLAVAGVVSMVIGKNKLQQVDAAPRATARSVRQDVRTVREALR